MKRPFTTAQRREGGRKRAKSLTEAQRREGGRKRAAQRSHREHNTTIAPDGYWAWSVYTMRGSTGLKLAMPSQIHFLRPEQLSGLYGTPLTEREQRLLFGLYVWKATFEGLPWLPLPTDDEFLAEVTRVQLVVGRGLPIGHPLDALYVAPNDFCDERGDLWGKTRQRKMFRGALRAARAYAESIAPVLKEVYGVPDCQIPDPQMFKSTASAPQWKPGQRRPMSSPPPQFPGVIRPIVKRRFGRPDLPSYDQENLMPVRPYAVAPSNDNICPWYVAVDPVTDDVFED